MKNFLTLILAPMAITLVVSGTSFAQSAEDKVIEQPDRIEYKRKTVVDFSDVTIQGELTKPEGSYILRRRNTSFETLLKIRGDFLPELTSSTDNL